MCFIRDRARAGSARSPVLRREVGLGSSVLATLIIALGFNPVRVRLQRTVDRALYGRVRDRDEAEVRADHPRGEQCVEHRAGEHEPDVQ